MWTETLVLEGYHSIHLSFIVISTSVIGIMPYRRKCHSVLRRCQSTLKMQQVATTIRTKNTHYKQLGPYVSSKPGTPKPIPREVIVMQKQR